MYRGLTMVIAVCLAMSMFVLAGATAHAQSCPSAQLAEDLGNLAADLSFFSADQESRAVLSEQFVAAPRQDVVVLQEMLGMALLQVPEEQVERVFELAVQVEQIEAALQNCTDFIPRLELKLSVGEHRELLETSDTVQIIAAPLEDEGEVATVAVYSGGELVGTFGEEELFAEEMFAETPSLVLISAETESLDPDYPLPTSEEPAEEELQGQIVDDFVGISHIWLQNDHEGGTSGDPEIYVRVIRFRFNPFGVVNEKVNLPGVNRERVWYNLGDPNSTYRFVSTASYAPVMRFEVWEEDSGFHGGDDHVGTVTVTWTSLSFGGYREFSGGDVRLQVDRD